MNEMRECIEGFVNYSKMNEEEMRECKRCNFMKYMSGKHMSELSKEWIIESIKKMDNIDFRDIFDVVRERHKRSVITK